jgi:hypothetical protein
MISILNEGFELQHVFATGYSKTFHTGANAPVLALGIIKGNQQKGSFVIKLKAGETMSDPSANMKELLAVFIAWELEIPVASPVLVDVSGDFLGTITDAKTLEMAKRSIGLNFGTVYIDNYQTLTITPPPEKLIPFAQTLFAFDLLIQNIDRTENKPNMLTNGEQIVAIDHEKAFSFIYSLFGPVEIWQLPETGKDWIKQHILRNLVKGKAFDAELFMDKCERLTPDFWAKAEELIPAEWKTEHFNTIKQKVSGFITNRQQFIKELQIIMS